MSILLSEEHVGKVLIVRVRGTLTQTDHTDRVPEFERLLRCFDLDEAEAARRWPGGLVVSPRSTSVDEVAMISGSMVRNPA